MASTLQEFEELLDVDAGVSVASLADMARHGIPDSVRGQVWQYLLGIRNDDSGNEAKLARNRKQEYAAMDKANSDVEKRVMRALSRFKVQDKEAAVFFRREDVQRKMCNVITAYSNYNSHYTYHIGSIYCLAPLMYVLRSETDSFFAFANLNAKLDETTMDRSLSRLMGLLRVHVQEVYEHFEEEEVSPNAWAVGWFETLLAAQLPTQCVLRLWDTYLSAPEGLGLHVYVCVAILQVFRDELVELDSEGILSFLMRLPSIQVDENMIAIGDVEGTLERPLPLMPLLLQLLQSGRTGVFSFLSLGSECENQMDAIVMKEFGTPDVLTLGKADKPSLRDENDLLIMVHATAVNRADTLQRMGKYSPPAGDSEILGLEIAGVVMEKGAAVGNFNIGDRVMALVGGGGYAQFCVVHASHAMPIKEGVSYIDAAATPETFLTAFQALQMGGMFDWKLGEKRRILLHAGGSGVSTSAIKLIRHAEKERKIEVDIMVTTSEHKMEKCIALGANHAFDRRTDWFAAINKHANEQGADILIDYVGGGDYFQNNLNCIAVDGHMIMLGFLGGIETQNAVNLRSFLSRRATIHGSTLRARSVEYKAKLVEGFLSLCNDTPLHPIVDKVFDLSEASKAHEYMHTIGVQQKLWQDRTESDTRIKHKTHSSCCWVHQSTTKPTQDSISGSLEESRRERRRKQTGDTQTMSEDAPTEVLNRRALEVIGRVDRKLTGRDFNESEELDVPQQVQRLIVQATSNENLCVAYIGWCAFW